MITFKEDSEEYKLWCEIINDIYLEYDRTNNGEDATALTEKIEKLMDKISSPVETRVMQKPAGSADEIFIKGKIEGLEEARWQIVYALPHIDPNGRLEKKTKYLMDEFKKVQDELKAKL